MVYGVIFGFKFLEVVGNVLNLKVLIKEIDLGGIKNWFELKDGILELKEFDVDMDDIVMKISGFYGFD